MIAQRFARILNTKNTSRFISGHTLVNRNHEGVATTTKDADNNGIVDTLKETKEDDLYRYLWVKCRGHEVQVLDSYEYFLKSAAENLNIQYVKTEVPFRVIKRKTMLACRFVKKKYRVQYEVRTYFRDLLFKNLTGSTVDTFLEYIERNQPDGVMLIAEKHRLAKLPFELEHNDEK